MDHLPTTHALWVGSSTAATTSRIGQGVWTGLGCLILTPPCLAFVSHKITREIIIFLFAAVFCDENAIPPFVDGTEVGTINWEERKEEDPERWNAFRSRLTYTCPVGFVIESPGRHNEQPEPIPETQEEFQVQTRRC